MKKHLIITLAIAGLAFTACGKKSAYKALVAQRQDPKKINPPASDSLAVKATKAINGDSRHQGRDAQLTAELREQIKGVSGNFSSNGSAASLQLAVLTKAEEETCTQKELKKDNISIKEINNIVIENTRTKCFDSSCSAAIVIFEKVDGNKVGSIAVLLEKKDGVLVPTTSIELFADVHSSANAIKQCQDELRVKQELNTQQRAEVEVQEIDARLTALAKQIKETQNGVASEEQKVERNTLLERRARLVQENKLTVGEAPASGEASAQEQQQTEETQKAKQAAVERIAAIDVEISEINSKMVAGETKDAEGNDLATKRSTLLAERKLLIEQNNLQTSEAPGQAQEQQQQQEQEATTVAPTGGQAVDPTAPVDGETPERD